MKKETAWIKAFIASALAAAFFAFSFTGCRGVVRESKRKLFLMDTYMELTVFGENCESAADAAEELLRRLDGLLSAQDPGSEISAINGSKGEPVSVSEETAELLRLSLGLSEELSGAFALTSYPLSLAWGFADGNYRIPDSGEIETLLGLVGDGAVSVEGKTVTLPDGMMLDAGACAKGYAAELALKILKEYGINSALLDLGSSTILAVGRKTDGSMWRIGVRDPFDSSRLAGIVEAEDCAVSTSGGYERFFVGEDGVRYCHIIDPAAGYPVRNGIESVTVITDDALKGDVLSTALFVMGIEGAEEFWRNDRSFEFIMLLEDGSAIVSEGAETLFKPENGLAVTVVKG